MQFHQGSRLEFFISKNGIKKKDLIEKSNVPLTTFYRIIKQDEILSQNFMSILKVLGVTVSEFFKEDFQNKELEIIKKELADCKEENEKLKDEVLQLHREARAEKKPIKNSTGVK